MRKSSYSEKLLDPRWQKKRLEILNRDNFQCQECGEQTKTLHVHHCIYRRDFEPWEYPEKSLVTLCCDCHAHESAAWLESRKTLTDDLAAFGFLASDFDFISMELFSSLGSKNFTKKEFLFALTDAIKKLGEGP